MRNEINTWKYKKFCQFNAEKTYVALFQITLICSLFHFKIFCFVLQERWEPVSFGQLPPPKGTYPPTPHSRSGILVIKYL